MNAIDSEDWRNAVLAFRPLVTQFPDNLLHRQALRGAEFRLHKENGRGKRHSERLLAPLRYLIEEASALKDWDAVDRLAENGLEFNPWDIEMNVAVGDACEQRGFADVAAFVLASALRVDSSRRDLWKRLQVLEPERFF
jgi:hypothetical protein